MENVNMYSKFLPFFIILAVAIPYFVILYKYYVRNRKINAAYDELEECGIIAKHTYSMTSLKTNKDVCVLVCDIKIVDDIVYVRSFVKSSYGQLGVMCETLEDFKKFILSSVKDKKDLGTFNPNSICYI